MIFQPLTFWVHFLVVCAWRRNSRTDRCKRNCSPLFAIIMQSSLFLLTSHYSTYLRQATCNRNKIGIRNESDVVSFSSICMEYSKSIYIVSYKCLQTFYRYIYFICWNYLKFIRTFWFAYFNFIIIQRETLKFMIA